MNDPVATPLPRIRVKMQQGQTVFYADANENGYYEFNTGLTGMVNISSDLTSMSVTVRNDPVFRPAGTTDLAVSQQATVPAVVNLTFNDPNSYSPWPSTLNTGQVNAFVAVEATHDWFSELQPTFDGIDENVLCIVNYTGGIHCNAFYRPGWNPPLIQSHIDLTFTECRSSAFSSIISHEYGHFILDKILGRPDGSFHEGVADTVASAVTATECFAGGWPDDTEYPCLRNIDAVPQNFQNFTPTTCPNPPCEVQLDDDRCFTNEPHCLGLALAGAFWDLRESIGSQATEELFADFLFITDGLLDQSVIAEVLIADDEDGDLNTDIGNEHNAEILAAFGLHGWTNPMAEGSGVEVKWQGPVQIPDPTSPADYVVHYEVIPPNVTLKTTRTQSGVPIERWFVGREDLTTGDRRLGTVLALWNFTGNPENITVHIGADAPPVPCKSVNVVDIPAQASTTWSNLLFKLDGDLAARAACYADSNDNGGRVSGSIGGVGWGIRAKGVGSEGAGPATLFAGGGLFNSRLSTLPASSTIQIEEFPGKPDYISFLTLDGPLDGTVQVNNTLWARIIAGASSSGRIRAKGDMERNILDHYCPVRSRIATTV